MGNAVFENEPKTPTAIDETASKAGLRAVAILEALKGVLVILIAIALIAVHDRIEDYVEDVLYRLHMDFDHRFAHLLLSAANKLGAARVLTVSLGAACYSSVRFIEAWGLWHCRVWAEWFALISGALYLPLEIGEVIHRVTWLRVAVLIINLVIVGYMLEIRVRAIRCKRLAAQQAQQLTDQPQA